ncbi:MAG: DUF1028 domain-containing protein [bacterium]|nr:DUF1028 domain-containing protein [bacterium]
MPPLRNLAFAALSLLLFALPARATWSILIVDIATGEVAIGIATCLTGFDLRPSTVVVVPGYGVAAAQSFVGPLNLRELIREEILKGTPANQILALLQQADPGHQSRQYGIAGVINGTATFTGTGAGAFASGLTGQVGNLLYTVQGNVITGQPVLSDAEAAIVNTPGSMGDKLMAAMEAARAAGGDGRCSCLTGGPTSCGSPPQNFTKSSHIGLMIWSRPSDVDSLCTGTLGCGAGDYWMDLNVANQTANAPDPVLQLQSLYNTWKAQQAGRPDHFQSSVTMSGTSIRANGVDSVTGTVWLRDAQGNPLGNSLPVTVGLSVRSTLARATFSPVVPLANGSYQFTMRGDLAAGEAILDVAVDDGLGRVGIAPQPIIDVTDAFGSCGTGAISDGQNGVLDALKIRGSAGVDRVIETGLGQPFVLSLDPPVGVPNTPPVGAFALWAHIGLPGPAATFPLGQGAGSLCFTPQPMSPAAPTLLLADSFGLGGWLAATRAPWVLGFPGVPALLDVTLQGAMVVDPQGTVAATNAILLRTKPLTPPTILSVNPPSATGGAPIRLQGLNFLNGAELFVAGQPVPTTARTPTTIDFILPQGLGCDTTVAVNNLGTTGSMRPFNATPAVTSLPFSSGPAAGGNLVVIVGSNLAGTAVTFNGVPMSITTQTSTSIVGNAPAGTPGPATIRITNAIGCATTASYTYL